MNPWYIIGWGVLALIGLRVVLAIVFGLIHRYRMATDKNYEIAHLFKEYGDALTKR